MKSVPSSTVRIKCDKCNGRGFYRASVSIEMKVGVANLALVCVRCGGRGTLWRELAGDTDAGGAA